MDRHFERRRAAEDEFWRTSETERPESDSLENIVNKAQDAAILLEILALYRGPFVSSRGRLAWSAESTSTPASRVAAPQKRCTSLSWNASRGSSGYSRARELHLRQALSGERRGGALPPGR